MSRDRYCPMVLFYLIGWYSRLFFIKKMECIQVAVALHKDNSMGGMFVLEGFILDERATGPFIISVIENFEN